MRCQLLRTKVKIESNDRDPISAAFHLLAKIEESLSELSLLFSETIDAVIDGIVGQAPLLGNKSQLFPVARIAKRQDHLS